MCLFFYFYCLYFRRWFYHFFFQNNYFVCNSIIPFSRISISTEKIFWFFVILSSHTANLFADLSWLFLQHIFLAISSYLIRYSYCPYFISVILSRPAFNFLFHLFFSKFCVIKFQKLSKACSNFLKTYTHGLKKSLSKEKRSKIKWKMSIYY